MSKTLKREYKANSKKSLCKSKKEKKCKKIKGCKMSKGPKKTFCRKIKNKKYRKTVKKMNAGFGMGDAVKIASKTPMGSQLMTKFHIDENKLKMMLNKLDEKKMRELMNGIKIDPQSMNRILKGDEAEIMKVMKENPQLTASLIQKMQQEVIKNPEMRKIMIEIMKETMHKGGELDAFLNSFTKNNTNRSFEDIARETKEHEQKAEEYRYKANKLAHDSENRYQTMDNIQTRQPFFNGGNQHLPEPNNDPAKLYREITERPMTNKTEIIERVKNEGLVNGDILVYDNDSYGLLTEDDIIFVGIDSNTFYDFEFVKEATKYTTNFFSKYKDLLKDSKRNSGVYDLRHDDEFITKQFDETKPEYMYKVDIDADDDENESITIISEYCLEPYERLRKKEIEGDLRTILKSV